MHQPSNYKTGQTVLIKSQSRTPGSTGYNEAVAMVGHICVVNADAGDPGISVLDPAMKTAWMFDHSEIAPCPRLSSTELRAIKLMAPNHRAEPASGQKMAIAGDQMCDVAAILGLAHHGLVAQIPGGTAWAPTEAGALLAIQPAQVVG